MSSIKPRLIISKATLYSLWSLMLLGKRRIDKLTRSPNILLVTVNQIISGLHKTPLLQGNRLKEG
jgi:hypothetical protein